MNELQAFTYEGNEVRTVQRSGETWWVLRDVCEILDLTTPARVAERLDEDEVSLAHIIDSIGRNQETTIVNESGLYNVIIRSDKPEAKQFKRWITHEVLPSIRSHGAYMTPAKIEEVLMNPDTIIQLATALKEEHSKIRRLEQTIKEQEPQVIFANAVSVSKTSILVGELAKILKQNGVDVGQNRLFG